MGLYSMALGSTQPVTDMSTKIFLWGKALPSRKADNLNAICDSIV
jgi:hypothetical protein